MELCKDCKIFIEPKNMLSLYRLGRVCPSCYESNGVIEFEANSGLEDLVCILDLKTPTGCLLIMGKNDKIETARDKKEFLKKHGFAEDNCDYKDNMCESCKHVVLNCEIYELGENQECPNCDEEVYIGGF